VIPFYPKFGSQEDAPGYGPSASNDTCENCAHYRDLGNQGYCEKFSFSCRPDYSCDDFRPSGVVKESSILEETKDLPLRKARAVLETSHALKERRIFEALDAAQKDLMPGRYDKAIENLKHLYPKEAASPFVQGLDPLAGEVARGAIQDRLDPNVSSEEMIRRRRLASLGGAVGGGILVPGVVAAGLGAGLGGLRGKGLGRISAAARGSGRALADTFHRASIPALAAGAGIGAMGARSQYDLGTGLAELASEKQASTDHSLRSFLRKKS
jgi:hypothetical protein